MTFLALLTKEMRLRMRRERTIWVIIVYILLMGLLGWFSLSRNSSYNNLSNNGLSDTGINLYYLLSQVQLFLIIFITPSFTATVVNGEKERQTYDMLLCSRLSAFSLVSGKLLAGLMNALLLIAASVPLFSLVFFFGGVSPAQVLYALAVYVVTAILIGTFGLFCSTLFSRPSISTAITYMVSLLWMMVPLIVSFILLASGGGKYFSVHPNQMLLMFTWNPIVALINTSPPSGGLFPYLFGMGYGLGYGLGSAGTLPPITIGNLHFALWGAYIVICLVVTVILFLLSMWTIKPHPVRRLLTRYRKPAKKTIVEMEAKA